MAESIDRTYSQDKQGRQPVQSTQPSIALPNEEQDEGHAINATTDQAFRIRRGPRGGEDYLPSNQVDGLNLLKGCIIWNAGNPESPARSFNMVLLGATWAFVQHELPNNMWNNLTCPKCVDAADYEEEGYSMSNELCEHRRRKLLENKDGLTLEDNLVCPECGVEHKGRHFMSDERCAEEKKLLEDMAKIPIDDLTLKDLEHICESWRFLEHNVLLENLNWKCDGLLWEGNPALTTKS